MASLFSKVGWLGTTVLMLKAQIGLGVLTIPFTFHSLGIVPGVVVLCVIGGITTWSGYMVGMFKLNHPNVYGVDDAGHLMFGPIGREILSAAFALCEQFPSSEPLTLGGCTYQPPSFQSLCSPPARP